MNQYFKLSIIVLVISVLTFNVGKLYFQAGFPYTHDGENHLARFANYKLALKEGQFPPRWAPNLMNHYGYPVFNYNYPLANILSSPFSLFKINYDVTFKILALTSVAFGLAGSYLWLRQLEFSLPSSLMGMATFASNPYLINIIYYRGNIGELMALVLLPWMFLIVEKVIARPVNWLVLLGIMTAFFLSHNLTVIFGTPLLLFYALVRFRKQMKPWRHLTTLLILSLALSLWFWLPALAESNLVVLSGADLTKNFNQHFPTSQQLFFSGFTFGFSYPGSIDSLSFWLGGIQITALILATIIFFRVQTIFKWLIVVSWLLILFQLKVTLPLWAGLPFVRYLQFPWRLSLFFSVINLPLVALAWRQAAHLLRPFLLALLVLQLIGISSLQAVDYRHKTQVDYDNYAQSTSTLNENLSPDFTYINVGDWQPGPTMLEGDGQIQVNYWTGSDRVYQLQLTQPSVVTEPTMNFAGWLTTANQEKLAYLNSSVIQGRIAFRLEPGDYQIRTRFTQGTWPRMVGNTASLATLVGLFFATSFRYVKRYF